MTTRREPSQRQVARERYLASARAVVLEAVVASDASAAPGEPSLTERVRALYEGVVVPVRDIARLVGVGERRIYRYARKLGWKARVRRLSPAARGRCDMPAEQLRTMYEASRLTVREIAALAGVSDVTINNYARKFGWRRRARWQARGAGGRFVGGEDAGRPHACALRALDPAGARLAAERCVRAAQIADDAVAAAAAEAQMQAARLTAEREAQAQMRAFEWLNAALVDLAKVELALGGAPGGSARAGRLAAALQRAILAQMERLTSVRGGDEL